MRFYDPIADPPPSVSCPGSKAPSYEDTLVFPVSNPNRPPARLLMEKLFRRELLVTINIIICSVIRAATTIVASTQSLSTLFIIHTTYVSQHGVCRCPGKIDAIASCPGRPKANRKQPTPLACCRKQAKQDANNRVHTHSTCKTAIMPQRCKEKRKEQLAV